MLAEKISYFMLSQIVQDTESKGPFLGHPWFFYMPKCTSSCKEHESNFSSKKTISNDSEKFQCILTGLAY